MPGLDPITPGYSIAITIAAATAAVALPTPTGNQVMISAPVSNGGATFINFGDSSVTVAVPSATKQRAIPILPGTAQTFTINRDTQTYIATIGTALDVIYVTVGDGF